ncbi:MAG TPA: penicillin-binding protein 2 [Nitrospirae bacterium]|nr:penicillin-binding protein 2 [Nitrospirota bacterium]
MIMQRRRFVVVTSVYIFFLVIFLRLSDLMILDHARMARIAEVQYTKGQNVLVRRGSIYDRRGKELAVNLERQSLYSDPEQIKSPVDVAKALHGVINAKEGRLIEKLSSDKRFVWLERNISPSIVKKIRSLGIEGLGLLPNMARFYPKGNFASHLLGFVNIDNVGLEGVEKRYDRFLSTSGGRVALTRDAHGNILYTEDDLLESYGNSIVLTIDEGLQNIVEAEIDRAVGKWRPYAATAIMMNPYNGEVLALANRPSFNPNHPGDYRPSYRRNRAVTDLYEPGSTFKLVMAAAALNEGVATLQSRFDCSEGYVEVGKRKIRDVHKHGWMTLKEIIQKSSNVGAVKVTLRLGPDRFYRYMKKLGFGEKTGIDLTGESSGIVKEPSAWSGTTIGAVAIGYEVMVTPLQILRAYAAVANDGYLVKPHVVSRIISPDGEVLWRYGPVRKKRVLSVRTTRMLRKAFKSVVSEDGTAPLAAVDGNLVAGKTGTTRMLDPVTKKYSRKMFVSSFVGMVPADNPVFVLVVVLWNPHKKYYGGEVAAPVFSSIAEKALSYMFVPRDDTDNEEVLVVGKPRETGVNSRDF